MNADEELAAALELGSVPRERFREHDALSPLPRAFQWIDGSAYLSHVELVRKARGIPMPPEFLTDPLLYQGGSDSFLAPRQPIEVEDEGFGVELEGEIGVIVSDVAMGATPAEARASIALIVLVNDVSLRNLIPAELAKGFGFIKSKPSSAFSPVAVTLDELGGAWDGGRLHLPCLSASTASLLGGQMVGSDRSYHSGAIFAGK
jgi:fumarylacetoacetate (FAA) hydrolase